MLRWNICVLLLFAATSGWAATARSSFSAGQKAYERGDMKSAIRRFKESMAASPEDPFYCYWLGRSYEALADIRTPLNRRPISKARRYLEKATELAPENAGYREELFDFLIETDRSDGALGEAKRVLASVPESDPAYPYMAWRLAHARDSVSSAEEQFAQIFLFLPRRFVEAVQLVVPDRETIAQAGSNLSKK